MKVVINAQFGGFSLSRGATMLYNAYTAMTGGEIRKSELFPDNNDIDRSDPLLIRVIEELGSVANGEHLTLKVIEIPDDIEWTVQDYDGHEWVAEKHRTWS